MILSNDTSAGKIIAQAKGTEAQTLPGIYESLEVQGTLIAEDAKKADGSGSWRKISGYDDAEITVKLRLIDNPKNKTTRFDYLSRLSGIFKKIGDDGKPLVYTLTHPQLNAWKIREVLFLKMKTSESRDKRILTAELSFVEHDPVAAKAEERKANKTADDGDTIEETEVPEDSEKRLRRLGDKYE